MSDRCRWTDAAYCPLVSETCCAAGVTAGELRGKADEGPGAAALVAAAVAAAAKREAAETDPVSVTALPSSMMESRFFRLHEKEPVNRTSSNA
jgi:hypothetical protein